jgi:hypothetical protein
MSRRQTKDESIPGGNPVRPDWFYPIDGGSVQVSGDAADGAETRDGSLECEDGVCPVPWETRPYRPELQPDLVNHPPHYTDGSIECIEAIEAQHTPEEYRGYLKGNIAKYIWRERHKGGTESLRKARFYLDRLIMFDED